MDDWILIVIGITAVLSFLWWLICREKPEINQATRNLMEHIRDTTRNSDL